MLKADPPAGSRNKGFEDIVVQDLSLNPQVTRYRRDVGNAGRQTIIAALDPGLVDGYGPDLHRLVLTLHFSGKSLANDHRFLNGMGVVIFEAAGGAIADGTRDVPRRGRSCIEGRPLRRLCHGRRYGSRHAGNTGYTTQIGSYNSRRFAPVPPNRAWPFLSRLCGDVSLYVITTPRLPIWKSEPASDRHRQVQGA